MRAFLFIVILLGASTAIANDEIAAAIKATAMDNAKYLEEENADRAMSTIHSQSLSYVPTKNMLPQIFGNYKLSYKIKSFKFVAFDGELAYARVKQETRKLSGAAFQNNELDMVQVYKQENGRWKVWSQANMSMRYIN